ncbi:hypothetical protein M9Y10_023915 [Tritrichomonas musculus]|uniref:Uncharacterized protein n=1 Tax=Tritrichomonas musculus TaxID=1915356 RepID=A0ABR2KWG0_9EUKA
MIYQLEKKKDKKIIQNIKESQVITTSQNEKLNNRDNKEYLIVGFEQTLIILECSTTSISFLQQILFDNPDINICFLQNTKALLIEVVEIKNQEIEADERFIEEIKRFTSICCITSENKIKQVWSIISPVILGHFYEMDNNDKIIDFDESYSDSLFLLPLNLNHLVF